MPDNTEALAAALADRYRIERELGRGGMATVFLAEDLRHHRQVAIKVLHPQMEGADGPKRFTREIRIVAQLSHPNILPMHDSGEAGGSPYFVMPYVEGESLRDRLNREGQLDVHDVVRIAVEVSDALSYAHVRGVVHRDIKPENIMLSAGHAVVADFGIARAVDAAAGDRLTGTGLAIGTPAYMGPEQWSGGKVDGRSDLYSLGCVVYEMLVGEPPYRGPTPQVVLARQASGTIPSIRAVRPTVPVLVEAAIFRALANVPADRFASVQEFREALTQPEPQATGAPVPIPVAGRARRRWLVAGATVVGLGLAAFGALRLLDTDGGTTVSPRRVVVALFENRTGDPSLDDIGSLATDWITESLQRSELLDVVPAPTAMQSSRYILTAMADRQLTDPIRALSEETGAGLVVSGSYYRAGDTLQFHAQVSSAIERRALGTLEPVTSPQASPMGAIEQLRERVTGVLAVVLDPRLASSVEAAARPPTFAAYREFNAGMERYIEADYRGSLAHFYRAFGLDSTFTLTLLYAAINHSNLGEMARMDSVLGIVARSRAGLSQYYQQWLEHLEAQVAGDRERALRAIRRVADLAPGSKPVYNAAYVALQNNRPGEALTRLQSLDPDRGPMRGWLPYWVQLADAHHRLGDHRRELDAARQARTRYPDRLVGVRLEGEALAALGRLDDVTTLVDSLMASAGGEGEGVVSTVLTIAEELRVHDHADAASASIDRAIAWYRARPAADARTVRSRTGLAGALDAAGRVAEATEILRTVAAEFPGELGYRRWLGVLAAAHRDREQARMADTWLASLHQPYTYGVNTLHRARIASLLGQPEQALELLRQARDEGLPAQRHPDRNFAAHANYSPLRDFFRPEG